MKFNLSILLFFISILIGQQNQFAGSEACSSCHPDQYDSWKKSTHGNAGGTPNKERILAPFDGQKIELKNGWFIPFKENNRYYFRSQENGFPEKNMKFSEWLEEDIYMGVELNPILVFSQMAQ